MESLGSMKIKILVTMRKALVRTCTAGVVDEIEKLIWTGANER